MARQEVELDGKCAIVTGAAKGIGAATAHALASAGAKVALLDMDLDRAEAEAAKLTGAIALGVDVSSPDDVHRTFEAARKALGGIDILVNNAGTATTSTLFNMSAQDWQRVIDVNLSGPFHCLQAALPALQEKGGSIINIASIAGKRISYHGGANYTASKAGLLGLTRHAAFELAPLGIRVNAVCPGPVLTPLVETSSTPQQREETARTIPLGAWITPQQIAETVLFLAGPRSQMCTGASFDVDGGVLVSNGQSMEEYRARRAMPNG